MVLHSVASANAGLRAVNFVELQHWQLECKGSFLWQDLCDDCTFSALLATSHFIALKTVCISAAEHRYSILFARSSNKASLVHMYLSKSLDFPVGIWQYLLNLSRRKEMKQHQGREVAKTTTKFSLACSECIKLRVNVEVYVFIQRINKKIVHAIEESQSIFVQPPLILDRLQ